MIRRLLCLLFGHKALETQQAHSRTSVFLRLPDQKDSAWYREEWCERCGVSFLMFP